MHIGVKLQQTDKWRGHIKDTISRAKRHVDILRCLMYKLSRKSIYITCHICQSDT